MHDPALPPALPELRLAPIPESSRAAYTGDRFSYMEAGRADAEPLLLLHGVGANAMHWRFQFAGLSDRTRVIAWNAPGYMLSDNLAKSDPDGSDYAGAVADFLSAVGIGRCHILANSFGARVALCFAAAHPDRVNRMVLTGTGIGQRGMAPEARAKAIAAREAQVAGGGYGFGARVAALLGAGASAATVALVQDVLRATNPVGFMQAVRFGLGPTSMLDLAPRVVQPVLLIQGAEDRVNPTDRNAALLAQALPDARLVVLDGAGHLLEVECWDAVNRLTAEHLLSPRR